MNPWESHFHDSLLDEQRWEPRQTRGCWELVSNTTGLHGHNPDTNLGETLEGLVTNVIVVSYVVVGMHVQVPTSTKYTISDQSHPCGCLKMGQPQIWGLIILSLINIALFGVQYTPLANPCVIHRMSCQTQHPLFQKFRVTKCVGESSLWSSSWSSVVITCIACIALLSFLPVISRWYPPCFFLVETNICLKATRHIYDIYIYIHIHTYTAYCKCIYLCEPWPSKCP